MRWMWNKKVKWIEMKEEEEEMEVNRNFYRNGR
jgi:hypothetical protein